MNIILLRGAAEQGLIYSLVALGLFLSYRILDIADLTVDGSFTLGAAASAMLTLAGHPVLGLFAALLAGGGAGLVTALLQTKLRVAPILAGIITMTALYSINLKVMGNQSNLPLLRVDTAFSLFSALLPAPLRPYGKLLLSGMLVLAVALALVLFLRTRLGLSIRATGDNRVMVSASSINPGLTITVGLCLANAMVGLSGAMLAQYQLFAENTMGTGMVVIGLASLIIGEVVTFCEKFGGVGRAVAACVLGAVLYRLIMAAALSASVSPQDLKLVSALIVATAISYPAIAAQLRLIRLKREAKADADA
ncbi:MAG: ABC transporter permease [Oscillospiraceae bacterium]